MYVWRIKLFDDCRRLEHANNQITANILRKIGILVRVVHLGLIIIAPPISVFVLVDLNLSQGLTHALPSEERNTISSTVILNGLAQDY